MQHDVAVLRRFNRSFTQRIGVLDDSFLGTGRSLGAARLLFELGPDGCGVQELRTRLGLDSGYVSRLLRRLQADGAVELRADAEDGRRRLATLTRQGRAEWDELDRRSDELAARLIEPLSERRRDQLREALATADRLLRAATIRFEAVDPRSEAAQASMQQYFDELDERFPTGFDPGDALTSDAAMFAPPDGVFVVAMSDTAAVACGGVQRVDEATGEIKRMWVHPGWRGVGIGGRLLERLEQQCRELGQNRVVLDTNSTLTEAIAMYEGAGYRATERYNDNPYALRWFEKTLRG